MSRPFPNTGDVSQTTHLPIHVTHFWYGCKFYDFMMHFMMEFPFYIFRPLAAVQQVNHVNTPTIPSGSSSFHTCTGIIIMMFLSVDALSILIHESNSLEVWSGQCCCCSDIRDVFAGTYSQLMSQTKTKLCNTNLTRPRNDLS